MLDIRLQLLNSPVWSLLSYFVLHNAPHIFSWKQVWTAGRSVWHLNSYTTRHTVITPAECVFTVKSRDVSEKDVIWMAAQVAWAPPYHHRSCLLKLVLVTIWMVLFLISPKDTTSMISKSILKCGHSTFFHSLSVYLRGAWAQRSQQCFWTLSIFGFCFEL